MRGVLRASDGRERPAEDLAAEGFAAVEVATGLRALVVDRAELRDGVQGDAGAVAALIHATRAVVFDDEFFRRVIACAELDHPMTATAAAGAGGKIGVRVDGADKDSADGRWRSLDVRLARGVVAGLATGQAVEPACLKAASSRRTPYRTARREVGPYFRARRSREI